MRFSIIVLCLSAVMPAVIAAPVADGAVVDGTVEQIGDEIWITKRCCILCDNGNRCGSNGVPM
ncbi:uncharacterized protein BO80DRAFT_450334 [Aspergillus ibericus CBS 121593]|uniref:Uncharacterized protein n=1 Tax=Aspergillus ibericus CBS 121593 TaxID=1448316 RepID=A0A395GMU1_9EURO|nr:hypothetical protein BO80DRAFT_450334 [Aspergillus ibericus CBS 121593]RAK95333.1 hypothetical protein BO80DRAFT_450334 [Aspergillus ibericus CBS 121593]